MARPEPSERRPRLLPAPLNTAFGGAFFLINLGLYLELYGDFSTPLTPGIELPVWDFIALVGRDLVGDAITADPVWRLLADLAGRGEDELPGASYQPPGSFQIPPSWLRPFEDDPAERERLTTPPKVEGASPLERWLALLLPYVRARLARALGVEARDAGRLVCAIPARVHVTVTHLDVGMSLADLPIEVRLAGLDRDPGWVPAAGRYVAFHFG